MTIEELADLVGVPVRTIRYYISEGLLPSPGTRGKGTVYGEEHLLRLRLIRMLVEQRVPLAEIRGQLERLSLPEIRGLLNEEGRRASERAQVAESPQSYITSLLGRARAGTQGPQSQHMTALPQPDAEPGTYRQEGTPGQLPGGAGGEEWKRWQLAPGVELHVRAEALGRYRRLVEQLIRVARPFVGREK